VLISCQNNKSHLLKEVLNTKETSEKVREIVKQIPQRYGSLKPYLLKSIGSGNLTYFIFTSKASSFRGFELEFKGDFEAQVNNVLKKVTDDLTFVRMDEIQNLQIKNLASGLQSGSFEVDHYCFKAKFLFTAKGDELILFAVAKKGVADINQGLVIFKKSIN
jgi:hypothetical protein